LRRCPITDTRVGGALPRGVAFHCNPFVYGPITIIVQTVTKVRITLFDKAIVVALDDAFNAPFHAVRDTDATEVVPLANPYVQDIRAGFFDLLPLPLHLFIHRPIAVIVNAVAKFNRETDRLVVAFSSLG